MEVNIEKAVRAYIKHREATRICAARFHEKNKDNEDYKKKRADYYREWMRNRRAKQKLEQEAQTEA